MGPQNTRKLDSSPWDGFLKLSPPQAALQTGSTVCEHLLETWPYAQHMPWAPTRL